MANQTLQVPPPVIDPDSVPETLCDGQFNIALAGQLATLTFTHWRPDPTQMFAQGLVANSAIVRARIVLTLPNLIALKDYLNNFIRAVETAGSAAPTTGGATKH